MNKKTIAILIAAMFPLGYGNAMAEEPAPIAHEPAPVGHEAAAEDEAQVQLKEVVVTGEKTAVPLNTPASTESVTAKQIEQTVNTVTSAGALQYLPSVHVRERYVGDINGILVMRVNSSIASAQTIVYADGMLLSNFLNNSFSTPPRWGMVSPEEIDRVDVIYGPFSALYPGNSAGGVVLISTHMPENFEAHAKLTLIQQQFKLFGTDDKFNGGDGAVSLGSRVGGWSWWLTGDHLDNKGQPQTFGVTPVSPASGNGSLGPVTGASTYVNPQNVPSIVTSAIGIDHTVQDNAKIKVAYDFSPTVRATYAFNIWQNDSDKTIESYLRNAAGQTVYQGNVKINGVNYLIPAPAESTQDSDYYMHGLKVESDTGGRWDWEVNASAFNESKDEIRTSSGNTGTTPSANATAGTIAIADGTGWKNLDLRSDFRPGGDLRSAHQLSFGYHIDAYNLQTDTYNLVAGANWKSSAQGALSTNSRGKTETQALYMQDAWQLTSAWKLIGGGRLESWQASDGSNRAATGVNVVYPDKTVSAFSPKFALSYQVSENWGLRGSYGRATRFPTVGELFANVTPQSLSGGALTTPQIAALPPPYNGPTNNPNLKPETDDSMELTAERYFGNGLWRNSLFGELKQNAIINTTDITSLPGYLISGNVNVDEIHTVGLESVLELKNALIQGLDFSASATWVHSIITEDDGNPGLVGTAQPRIPNFRTTLSGTYHQNERLSYTLNYRYSGRQHVALYNTTTHAYTDPNPSVYGTTVSDYSVFDAKVNWNMTRHWTVSAGINNIGNYKYYVNPNPYPQRTFYASLKFDY